MEYKKNCLRCGKLYTSGSNRRGYCPNCRKIRQIERNREYAERKKDGAVRMLGSADVCANCGKPFIIKSGSQILCEDCIKKGVKTTKSKANTKYRDKTYDTITVYVPKGDKEQLKAYATSSGFKSLNDFINHMIDYGINKNICIEDCLFDNGEDDVPF